MKKKFSIRKIIILLIAILIPVLASTFIGIYSYNRYTPYYFDQYMNQVEESTSDKAHAFLKYTTDAYEKTPYFEENVMKDDVLALTVEVYRSIETVTTIVDGLKTLTNQVHYHFAVYNVNYNKLIKIKNPSGEDKLEYNNVPQIYVKITDQKDNEKVEVLAMSVPNDSLFIKDYTATPDKDFRNNDFTNKYLKWVTFKTAGTLSNDVKIEVLMSDKPEKEAEASYYSVISQFTKNDFENKMDNFDSFEDGYSNNYQEAGYFGYILKKQLWWHVSLALVATGFVSVMFYVVWNYEEEQLIKAKTKQTKK